MAWPTLPREHRDAAVEYLVRHRAMLVSLYLAVLGLMLFTLFRSTAMELPEAFLRLIGLGGESKPESPTVGIDAMLAGAFFLLQAIFITGFGKVRVRGAELARPRLLLSVAIFSALMALLSWGLFASAVEMVDRATPGPLRSGVDLGDRGAVLFGATWVLWLVISAFALRGVRGASALGRLAGVLLLGSWIEFAMALPIEVVARPRERDCPCSSGSWLALFAGLPILVWAIGPALVLLFVREIRLWRQTPHRPRAILARKSGWTDR